MLEKLLNTRQVTYSNFDSIVLAEEHDVAVLVLNSDRNHKNIS